MDEKQSKTELLPHPGMEHDLAFYRLFGKCRDGTIVMSTLPGRDIRRFAPEDAEGMYEYAVEQGKAQNVYISPNPRSADLTVYARGKDEDVGQFLCLVVDGDVYGPAHKEENLPPSKDAVIGLLMEQELKPTLLIDSGYGVYGYYLLSVPVPLDDTGIREKISGIARGFGHRMIGRFAEHGWKLDDVYAISHMFRAPGSQNHKLTEPVECHVVYDSGPVYSLDDWEPCYEAPAAAEHTPFQADEREVGSARRIMDRCAFVQKLVDDPNAVTEPEWKAACSNISLAADGADLFHDWSSLYADYDYDETARKIRYSEAAKKPCTCKYIREHLGFPCPEGGCGVKAPVVHALYTMPEKVGNLLAEGICENDVYDPYILRTAAYAKENMPAEYGRIKLLVRKTGIGLRDFERAVRNEAEKQTAPDFDIEPTEVRLEGLDLHGAMEPRGYRISMDAGVSEVSFTEGLGYVCLCHEPVVITGRLENIDSGQERLELSHYRNGRWKQLVAPRSTILNKNKLVGLADCGLPVSTDNAEGVVRYLTSYEAANIGAIPFKRSINRIGWVGKEFFPCLTEGEIVYEGDDTDNILGALSERGDYASWLDMAATLRENSFARAILAASFASPLLELLQNRVILLHLWHSSKSGKTAILKFALSVWGDPLRLMANFNTTAVGLERRAGTLRHLPLGLDELQVLNEKRLSPALVVYSLGNGYGKTRGAKSGGLQEVPTWRNCIISTGEQPLTSENAMDGVSTRVLELYGAPIPDTEFGRRVHQLSESCYGHAGKRYIEYIAGKDTIRQDYDELRSQLLSRFDGDAGAHLDNIAVLALADCYASVCLFGMDRETAFEDAISLGNAILRNARSLEKEDVIDRAWHYIVDWVAANKTRFESSITPCYGKIETNKVYMIAAILKQALEDGGYCYTKSVRGFRDRGYIETFANAEGKENTQCQKKIRGINVRAICLKLDVQPDTEDFLADPIVPLTRAG